MLLYFSPNIIFVILVFLVSALVPWCDLKLACATVGGDSEFPSVVKPPSERIFAFSTPPLYISLRVYSVADHSGSIFGFLGVFAYFALRQGPSPDSVLDQKHEASTPRVFARRCTRLQRVFPYVTRSRRFQEQRVSQLPQRRYENRLRSKIPLNTIINPPTPIPT